MIEEIKSQLDNTLDSTDFEGKKYNGKVRDNYIREDDIVMITTDRISAFDHVLGTIPFKGQVLNELAMYWFKHTKDIIQNHIISSPDPNVMIVKKCRTYPVEVVVRDYITGSLWRDYEGGNRNMYGLKFPEALKKNQKLPEVIITPSTKEDYGKHDMPISEKELLAKGMVAKEKWEEIKEAALKLFARGTELAAKQGLILVDTKYEFGEDKDGNVVLIDEIHTPDSSRYWIASTYDDKLDPTILDKEFMRDWLRQQGFSGEGTPPKLSDDIRIKVAQRYIELFETITGGMFIPAVGNVKQRIKENLGW